MSLLLCCLGSLAQGSLGHWNSPKEGSARWGQSCEPSYSGSLHASWAFTRLQPWPTSTPPSGDPGPAPAGSAAPGLLTLRLWGENVCCLKPHAFCGDSLCSNRSLIESWLPHTSHLGPVVCEGRPRPMGRREKLWTLWNFNVNENEYFTWRRAPILWVRIQLASDTRQHHDVPM